MTRKFDGDRILIATHNAGKLEEMEQLFAPFGVSVIGAAAMDLPEPEETENTFVGNALIKARAAVAATGLPALADDSGIEVDGLNGAPGVYTADWAERQWFEGEPGRDWYMAMGKVEGMLQELGPDTDRSAAFHCTLAVAWPDGEHAVYEGVCPGELTWPPRGTLGFGYDPVFVPSSREGNETFAEIDPEEKHAISHRADAFAKLVADQFGAPRAAT